MFIIKDTVECGYFDDKEKGGTIDVSITIHPVDKDYIPEIIKIIDYFDHCVITDDPEVVNFSERYFLIPKKVGFLEDVANCLGYLLKDDKVKWDVSDITITLGKISYKVDLDYLGFSHVIDYCVKG